MFTVQYSGNGYQIIPVQGQGVAEHRQSFDHWFAFGSGHANGQRQDCPFCRALQLGG